MLVVGDVRAIVSKGWSSRMEKDTGPEIELPPEIYSVRAVTPHISLQTLTTWHGQD